MLPSILSFARPSLLMLTSILTLTSCATKTETGALSGAGIGALAGGLISHSPGGALIGAAVGTVGGAVVGHLMEEDDQKKLDQGCPKTSQKVKNGEPLTYKDVIHMSRSGMSDQAINSCIDATNSTFTEKEIDMMSEAGVPAGIIQHIKG